MWGGGGGAGQREVSWEFKRSVSPKSIISPLVLLTILSVLDQCTRLSQLANSLFKVEK